MLKSIPVLAGLVFLLRLIEIILGNDKFPIISRQMVSNFNYRRACTYLSSLSNIEIEHIHIILMSFPKKTRYIKVQYDKFQKLLN